MLSYLRMDTIFSKIISREVSADIVYEDDIALAFLDIAPVTEGHTLVIPKKWSRNFFDTDEATLQHLFLVAQKIARSLQTSLGAKGVNVQCNSEPEAGQTVFHFHIHLIPRFGDDALVLWPQGSYEKGRATELAQKIKAAIH